MPQLKPRSTVSLILSAVIAGGSAWLALGSGGIFCERLPSMTICATLSAFVIALSFRQVARAAGKTEKCLLAATIFVAATTLFADARFILKYHGICSQLQEQIRQMQTPH